MATQSRDNLFAVALRTPTALRLLARIRRSDLGDVYLVPPTSEPEWNPHASYHRSGMTHLRSFGAKHFGTQRQKPGPSFKGVETVLALALPGRQILRSQTACNPAEFNQVFEVPEASIQPAGNYALAVDLAEAGAGPATGPWQGIVAEWKVTDRVPWILITLWAGPS